MSPLLQVVVPWSSSSTWPPSIPRPCMATVEPGALPSMLRLPLMMVLPAPRKIPSKTEALPVTVSVPAEVKTADPIVPLSASVPIVRLPSISDAPLPTVSEASVLPDASPVRVPPSSCTF